MTTEELEQALEHDLAQKGLSKETPSPVVLARYCLQNAAVAIKGAEAALVLVRPPGVLESMQAIQLAIASLEQSLILLGTMESSNEQRNKG